ncbi:hypothetical protein DCCM_4503 [Desulfocucumis palustris]|uniref:Probable membrane transporter protein n=1 Tax=Desulfocucumis palustris TaxID=1898651 RepID=A0A2L2XGX3_9FIRM|nr:sulfite exporter TauE/SafE family protein [Desulfocucumis palustris]GBF35380.1 hypothetical protein DCCM_4503 [Desulfocucumis palustris]
MLSLSVAGTAVNPLYLFAGGILVGILRQGFGQAANLFMVPLLNMLGIPLNYAAGAGITQNFSNSAFTCLSGNPKKHSLRRVGFVVGLMGLPGIIAGRMLYIFLAERGIAAPTVHSAYVLLTLFAAFGYMRHWRTYYRHGYFEDNPLPPFGLRWRYPLAAPGAVGLKHITVGRVTAVGLLLGFATGLLGLGGSFAAAPLFMYVLGLPAAMAAASSVLPILIIDSAGMVSFSLTGNLELLLVLVVVISVMLGDKIALFFPAEIRWSNSRLIFAIVLAVSAAAEILNISGSGMPAGKALLGACTLLVAIISVNLLITSIKHSQRTAQVEEKPVH